MRVCGCVMSNGEFFCVVCQEALVLRIYSIVDPIESCSPAAVPQGIREPYKVGEEPLELRVQVMKPATHALEVALSVGILGMLSGAAILLFAISWRTGLRLIPSKAR